jgi:parvulin-like peptidyl-prolyl isomerase
MPPRNIRRLAGKKTPKTDKDKDKGRKNKMLYWGSVIVLVLIVIAFIGAPMVSRMVPARRMYVFGSYDGQEIAAVNGNYFYTQYKAEAERISQYGQEGSLESKLWQAWRYAFNQTVLHMAIMAEAERSGVWVSGDRVEDSLVEYGPYMVNGEFSIKKYQATPQVERNAVSRLRKELLTEQIYYQDLFSLRRQSTKEKEAIRKMMQKERRFSIVAYNYTDFPDEKVLSYGLANKVKFQKIKLSRILITSGKSEAEKVREMILTGQSTFDDLARSFSKGPFSDKGGDMGWQYYHYFQALFDDDNTIDEIFSMKQDEISELIPSGRNWVFFRCDSNVVAPDFENPGVLDTVRNYVVTSERGVIDTYFVEEAEDFKENAEKIGFDQASLVKGLFPPVETEYFPINFNSVFSEKPVQTVGTESSILASASQDEDFFVKIFSLKKGEISDPITLGDNILVITLLDERQTSEEDLEMLLNSTEYLGFTSLNRDLGEILIDYDKLEDNFQEAFFTYVVQQ